MIGMGTLINTAAVIAGGLLGLCLKNGLKKRMQEILMQACGLATIFIGASGAMMDLAVDITSAVNEVIEKKPEIGWREAFVSCMNVGRAAMGTMTTTLLLAYSGGYIALLMVFKAQGTPVIHILNYKYVSAEILDTMVGSFGLVTVAPFTALTSSLLLTGKYKKIPDHKQIQESDCENRKESIGKNNPE